ncbi:tetratricopeptide repeat protein [Sorangium sp. So ce341]|uniref:tetratricopeptide repeat protein n=1 Tax=Sorangium sp. So ce341 TaxID=3133302 RepID=UPI003F60210C
MERRELDGLTREELIARAEGLGVPRPRVLTKAELVDEILARTAQGEPERARLRGFLGRARDLLSRVVERGLHMPETARALRGEAPPEQWPPPPPPPRATTTLAEIYASQGHTDRAIAVLDEILERDPQHEDARRLRERLIEQAQRAQGEGAGAQGAGAGGAEDEEDAEAEEAEDAGAGVAEAAEAEEADAAEVEETGAEAAEAKETGAEGAEAEEAGDEAAEAEEAGAEAAKDTGAEAAEAKDTGAETAKDTGAETAKDTGSSEHPEAPTAGEQDRRPEPVSAAPDLDPAQPPRDPSPADAPAPAAIAERAVAGAAPGLAAALQDERAELPARYDLDEVVGLAVDPETLYVYWEVRPRTLARARARRPGGQLVIRVVAVLPSWERPVVEQRDLAIDALFGDMFVRDIPAGSHLRMCTGWLDGDVFEPFAVGLEVAAPRAMPLAPRSPTPEPDASAQAALQDEVPADRPAGPTRDAQPHLEGAGGGASPAASGALDAAAPSRPASGASGQAGESVAAAYAAGAGSVIAPPPAPSAPAASSAAHPGAAEAAPVAGSDVATDAAPPVARDIPAPAAARDIAAEAAAPAASSDATKEAAAPAASSDAAPGAIAPTPLGTPAADAVAPDPGAAIAPGPALASPSEGPPRFPSGTAPTAEALAQAVAATREPPSEGPPRFPSGTAPTAEALAQAVAATRGGSSDLLRGGGGSAWPGSVGQPHASEAFRRGGAERPRSLGGASELRALGGASELRALGGASELRTLGGASELRAPGGASELRAGADRSRPPGGGTELWRSFATAARPSSGSR